MRSTWRSVHIHYHDEAATPALILDAVQPFFAAVAAGDPAGETAAEATYFLRHWARGPHVRCQILVTDAAWSDRIRPELDAVIGGYLRERPSRAALHERDYIAIHHELAKLECEPGPLSPWAPDNTVHERPYDPRLHVLGTHEASELLASFYTATNDLAFRMLEHERRGGDLRAAALDLMWTTAHAGGIGFTPDDPPITRGFISFRSHADQTITRTTAPARTRAAFERRYAGQEDVLAARLATVMSIVDGTAPAGGLPFVAEWAALVRAWQPEVDRLRTAGRLPLEGGDAAPRLKAREVTEFQSTILGSARFQDWMHSDPWFLTYRVLLNYLYLHLTRLGVKPLDRALLCHLAANTVERSFDVSATALVRRYADADRHH